MGKETLFRCRLATLLAFAKQFIGNQFFQTRAHCPKKLSRLRLCTLQNAIQEFPAANDAHDGGGGV